MSARSTWQCYVDSNSEKTYYYNTETKQTQWEQPEDYVEEVVETQEHHWVQYTDAETGKEYFYDTITKKTQWHRPDSYDISRGKTTRRFYMA